MMCSINYGASFYDAILALIFLENVHITSAISNVSDQVSHEHFSHISHLNAKPNILLTNADTVFVTGIIVPLAAGWDRVLN